MAAVSKAGTAVTARSGAASTRPIASAATVCSTGSGRGVVRAIAYARDHRIPRA
jgi:hypothetical protein